MATPGTQQYTMREVGPAPEKLVDGAGDYILGCFNTPIKQANLLDAKSSICCPRMLKDLQLREWQAFQIKTDTHFVMIAIYNAKKMSLVQFIVYNLELKFKLKYEKKVFSWELTVPDSLHGSYASYQSADFSIRVDHDLTSNLLNIDVSIQDFESMPPVQASFKGVHDTGRYTPMVVCNPFSSEAVMYSHKCLMPAEGRLRLNTEDILFPLGHSQLIIDDHKGYYPYVTTYDWVTSLGLTTPAEGEGQNSQGEGGGRRLVGFNLTNNQVRTTRATAVCVVYTLPPTV